MSGSERGTRIPGDRAGTSILKRKVEERDAAAAGDGSTGPQPGGSVVVGHGAGAFLPGDDRGRAGVPAREENEEERVTVEGKWTKPRSGRPEVVGHGYFVPITPQARDELNTPKISARIVHPTEEERELYLERAEATSREIRKLIAEEEGEE